MSEYRCDFVHGPQATALWRHRQSAMHFDNTTYQRRRRDYDRYYAPLHSCRWDIRTYRKYSCAPSTFSDSDHLSPSSRKMTKVLVFGTGGVGSVYGYICDKGGAEVTAVCRGNYSKCTSHGITIRSKLWGECHYKPHAVQTIKDSVVHGPFDYIIVASKAFPGTAEMISDAVTPGYTAIALAQNGIALEEDYAKLYATNTIISGVVYLPVTQVEPGVVEMGPLERFEIGTYPANASSEAKAQAQKLSDLWKAGGAHAPVFHDVQSVKWLKVAVNASKSCPVSVDCICKLTGLSRLEPDDGSDIV